MVQGNRLSPSFIPNTMVNSPLQEEVARLNQEIHIARENIVRGRFLGSVFIRCSLQLGAHVLAQCVSYHEVPFHFSYLILQ
jgi:hypothetical protein